ncbi:hypothetical protein Pst134EB_005795 [Puccinia striiformis f. sp. tritici]|nr:hypothetical protein Pst134EB_005786 [Puccinia striiformis f. sp. tritici]KAH9461879.1 hypothetical protein Pst134EB_005795 [Puccinia striiformis f. sp. tritici]
MLAQASYLNDCSAGNDSTLSKWTAVQSEISGIELTLVGDWDFPSVVLQAPADVDRQHYELSVNQQLNHNKSPAGFGNVAEIIQYAMGKLKSTANNLLHWGR